MAPVRSVPAEYRAGRADLGRTTTGTGAFWEEEQLATTGTFKPRARHKKILSRSVGMGQSRELRKS